MKCYLNFLQFHRGFLHALNQSVSAKYGKLHSILSDVEKPCTSLIFASSSKAAAKMYYRTWSPIKNSELVYDDPFSLCSFSLEFRQVPTLAKNSATIHHLQR
jgi:hypothetical protein